MFPPQKKGTVILVTLLQDGEISSSLCAQFRLSPVNDKSSIGSREFVNNWHPGFSVLPFGTDLPQSPSLARNALTGSFRLRAYRCK